MGGPTTPPTTTTPPPQLLASCADQGGGGDDGQHHHDPDHHGHPRPPPLTSPAHHNTWPAGPPPEVAKPASRKTVQIQTWRAEVADHGPAAFCACSAAYLTLVSTSTSTTATSTASATPASCTMCARPTPLLRRAATFAGRGGGWGDDWETGEGGSSLRARSGGVVRRALEGIKGLVRVRKAEGGRTGADRGVGDGKVRGRRRQRSRRGGEEEKEEAEEAAVTYAVNGGNGGIGGSEAGGSSRYKQGVRIDDDLEMLRTEMYRASGTGDGVGADGGADPDGSGEGEGGAGFGPLSPSSRGHNPRGLFERNERLRRAQRLLAKNRGAGPGGGGGGENVLDRMRVAGVVGGEGISR